MTHNSSMRRLAAATTLLILLASSHVCQAFLRDRGPPDATLGWPQWYRDRLNLAIGLCTSTAERGGAPLCFPLVADPVPPSFSGNVGSEVFYFNLQHLINPTGSDITLRYVAAVEAAYVGTVAQRGDEAVFTRIRIRLGINDAAASCAGEWTFIHPYGVNTFTDVAPGPRAIFATFDVPGLVALNFDGALDGNVGPFIRWAEPDGSVSPPIVAANGDQFIGDPNVPHAYTGSPFVNPADRTIQNYVEIIGPAGCNVNGNGGRRLRETTGLLLGQIWTAPIPTPTSILSAVYSRAGNTNVIDVEATTETGNTLVLVGPPGFPSTPMVEDKTAAGVGERKYHAQVVVNDPDGVPQTINVVNLLSTPVVAPEARLTDIVQVSRATLRADNNLCVDARSSDSSSTSAPTLSLLHPDITGPAAAFTSTGCTPPTGFVCICAALPNNPRQVTSQSATVTVVSSKGGSATVPVVYEARTQPVTPPATPTLAATNKVIPNVAVGGPTSFPISAGDTFPATARFLVATQLPLAVGSVTVTNTGTATFTPASTVKAGTEAIFSYVIADGNTVSNVGVVTLTLTDVPLPPVTTPDAFPVQVGTSRIFNVLANDRASGGTTMNLASLQTTPSTLGRNIAIPAPADGRVNYTAPSGAPPASVDFFNYTVASNPGNGRSLPTLVSVSLPTNNEALSYVTARGRTNRWVITVGSTTPGWAGSVGSAPNLVNLNTVVSCYIIRRSGIVLNPPEFIGRTRTLVLDTAVAAFPAGTIDERVGSAVTLPNGQQGTVPACNVNRGLQCTIQCGSNWVIGTFPDLTSTPAKPTQNIIVN